MKLKDLNMQNLDLCELLVEKKLVSLEHRKIAASAKDIGYPIDGIFTLTYQYFYGNFGTDDIFNKFDKDLSPVNFFRLNTMKVYRQYIGYIPYILKDAAEQKFRIKDFNIDDYINRELSDLSMHFRAELNNEDLPEVSHLRNPLPKSLSVKLIAQALATLKNAGRDTLEAETAILLKMQKTKLKAEIARLTVLQKPQEQAFYKNPEALAVVKEDKKPIKSQPKVKKSKKDKSPTRNLFNYELIDTERLDAPYLSLEELQERKVETIKKLETAKSLREYIAIKRELLEDKKYEVRAEYKVREITPSQANAQLQEINQELDKLKKSDISQKSQITKLTNQDAQNDEMILTLQQQQTTKNL